MDRTKKIKVAIGMSGGVDSSVAATLLKQQGFEVVGFMMKLWSDENSTCSAKDNACCDIDGLQDAKRIAAILDIPFYVIDVREKFKKEIADYFIDEYKNLRTPNPCVKCNEKIKFGWLLDFAKSVGCDFLATGHYAKIVENGPKFHLLKGKDEIKDQSYFLYRLNQKQLSKIIFPIGGYSKIEVREMAKKFKLPVHEKKESQEICFVAENDYRQFLRRHIPAKYFLPGEIVDINGNVVGRHDGLINYTIGQRKGIEQDKITKIKADKTPLYVVDFNVKKNQLIVGNDSEIYKNEMVVGDFQFINPDTKDQLLDLKNLTVKIRYRHSAVGISSLKYQTDDKSMKVCFEEPQRAITPGQSAVFYLGDEVLGGGIIQ